MLHENELPKEFWAEAANTTVFLQNRLLPKFLEDKTPFEVRYGYKSSLNFLKVFGSVCFAHIPQVKRDKPDKKAISSIFMGYSSVSKAYKVYHPQKKKRLSQEIYTSMKMNNGTRRTFKRAIFLKNKQYLNGKMN
jgi:hypothetical protein